ncbi:MAG: hypothetical protein MJZ16_00585 [Bacteroidales bacterium]|nr:hypothetical protein [Bacteroidales bacterium]
MSHSPFLTIKELYQGGFISVRSFNCCEHYNVLTIQDLSDYKKANEGFRYMQNCGAKTIREFENVLGNTDWDEKHIQDDRVVVIDYSHGYSSFVKEYIEYSFGLLIQEVSSRVRTIIMERVPSLYDLMSYKECDRDYFIGWCPGKTMNKTADDIFRVKEKAVELLQSAKEFTDMMAISKVVGTEYPYLNEDALDFVVSYYEEHRTYPMLYILKQFLLTGSSSYFKVILKYCYSSGIGNTQSVASELSLSKERVRQILTTKLTSRSDFIDIIKDKNWVRYKYSNFALVSNVSQDCQIVCKDELVDLSFVGFSYLLKQIYSCDVVKCGSIYIAVPASLNRLYKLKKLFDVLKEAKVKGTYGRDQVSVQKFCRFLSPDYLSQNKRLFQFLKDVLFEGLGIELDESGSFQIPTTRLFIEEDIISILEEYGSPLSIPEIYCELEKKNPSIKDKLMVRGIYRYLANSNKIEALGRTGKYALKSWNRQDILGIRGEVYSILSTSGEPLLIDDIESLLKEVYPSTNKRSITANLQSDVQHRFVQYENGFWGLSGKQYGKEYVEAKVEKQSPEERLEDLRSFVEEYRRMPTWTGDAKEKSLCRWVYNVHNGYSCSEKVWDAINEIRQLLVQP